MKLEKKEIIKLLPHRPPMLLIDEIYDIKNYSGTALVSVKEKQFFCSRSFSRATNYAWCFNN